MLFRSLLNPSAALAEKIENKITLTDWLEDLAKYLPPYTIAAAKDLIWKKEPMIIQWAHGHTGDGTILVNNATELQALQQKFPDRVARASAYANGPSFTLNVVVTDKGELALGNISYQITGLFPFTENAFSTVGNDWSLPHSLLNEREVETIHTIAREVAGKMATDGWHGLFGIDLIKDEDIEAAKSPKSQQH